MKNIQVVPHHAADGEQISYDVVIPMDKWNDFKTLVHRATNLWPDAPPHIKEFADIVTNGQVLQNYYN